MASRVRRGSVCTVPAPVTAAAASSAAETIFFMLEQSSPGVADCLIITATVVRPGAAQMRERTESPSGVCTVVGPLESAKCRGYERPNRSARAKSNPAAISRLREVERYRSAVRARADSYLRRCRCCLIRASTMHGIAVVSTPNVHFLCP